MRTLHLVSHTHWDREWYLTFQQFRLKLVHLIDGLLDILDHDRNFKHFMLDGQTIVLDDYLLMRPQREADLRRYIKNGRILIGPWHILPDEFLVSPEATIRNLLEGDRTCRNYSPKMMVGYIPDPFGHIGQMPQILRGFGIETACVQRGLSDQPCEFWWEAPDGSRVFMAYLRDGYGNAALLPASEPERFTALVREVRDNLAPYSASDHLLLMYGTDHMQPPPETARAIACTKGKLDGDKLVHSTLPAYIAAVQKSLRKTLYQLPVITGELRQCKRSHLLPGVLSARMWIKQRNHACETLLEKWAEPFSTWQELVTASTRHLSPTAPQSSIPFGYDVVKRKSEILHQAWRLLMENHPHDSICGCSIDQVHDEMKVRFDQVEQIGEEITKQSLEALASATNTAIPNSQPATLNPQSVIVVFNPTSGPRTDLVTAFAEFHGEFEIVDEQGNVVPHQMLGSSSQDLINAMMSKKELKSGLAMIHEGRILGKVIHEVAIQREGSQVHLEVVLADSGELDLAAWENGVREIEALLADPTVTTFHARAHSVPASEFILTAKEIPGHGYKTFWLRPVPASLVQPVKVGALASLLMPLARLLAPLPFLERLLARPKAARPPYIIENEYLHVEGSPADGALTIKDKRTGAIYRGLNRFMDGGDCGDEYNYSPPPSDFQPAVHLKRVSLTSDPIRQTLSFELELPTPAAIAPDRKSRSKEMIVTRITSHVTLTAGVPRVDIHTEVDNRARDHRLRVHFPTPFAVTEVDYDGHFEIVRRPIGVPEFDESWVERPRPEVPQRAFTSVSDGQQRLTVANRGLPEVEVLRLPKSSRSTPETQCRGLRLRKSETTEIALTLLRCINWISRDDFEGRRGHAGPMASTPGAQMIGLWTFDYSIIPHAVGRDSIPPSSSRQDRILPYHQAYAFETPLRAVSTGLHDGPLPACGSFVESSPQDFVISAVKETEDGNSWLVRGYNISGEEINVTLKPWRKFRRFERVNLAEEKLSALRPAADGRVEFTARAHEIVTIMLNN
jgi:alpha-mannosidase